jgi:hypothetical protein
MPNQYADMDSDSESGHEMTTVHSHIHRIGSRRGYAAATNGEEAQFQVSSEQQAIDIFMNRQTRASSCWRQMLTISTVIIIVQVCIL